MIRIAKSNNKEFGILPKMANRHGLITGSTGSGKTTTLQTIIEGFSKKGIPVFVSDVKGDLAGLSQVGKGTEKFVERYKKLGFKRINLQNYPVRFWDIYGKQGLPVRTTIAKMGPVLLSKLLDLTSAQSGTLLQVFKIADDRQYPLVTVKDLSAVLQLVFENAKALETDYGRIATVSVGAIQRTLLGLEMEQGEMLFDEPTLSISDLISCTSNGYGFINILAADKLISSPRLYAAFLLWLLTELYETQPEVGDIDKPKFVLCLDEAHLLFENTPKVLLSKIEQIVRLIRSKAIGVYFITQSPSDIPETILAQLGNRIQHSLRAYTPKDFKAVKVAAQSMRTNPVLNTEKVISELKVGEALVSFLNDSGSPSVVERALVFPPRSRIGSISDEERMPLIFNSALYNKYCGERVNKQTASDMIEAVRYEQPIQEYPKSRQKEETPLGVRLLDILLGSGSKRGGLSKLLKLF